MLMQHVRLGKIVREVLSPSIGSVMVVLAQNNHYAEPRAHCYRGVGLWARSVARRSPGRYIYRPSTEKHPPALPVEKRCADPPDARRRGDG